VVVQSFGTGLGLVVVGIVVEVVGIVVAVVGVRNIGRVVQAFGIGGNRVAHCSHQQGCVVPLQVVGVGVVDIVVGVVGTAGVDIVVAGIVVGVVDIGVGIVVGVVGIVADIVVVVELRVVEELLANDLLQLGIRFCQHGI
jgi:hypothetical protein